MNLRQSAGRVFARELLDDAIDQTRGAPPIISVPAHLHIARVLTAWNHDEARSLLIPAVRRVAELIRSDSKLNVLLREAHMLTAATAPELNAMLPPLPEYMLRSACFPLIRTMLDHGHSDAACDYLMKLGDSDEFPHVATSMFLQERVSTDRKLALARRAVQAWRNLSSKADARPRQLTAHTYVRSFLASWRILPEPEASAALHDIVAKMRREKEFKIDAEIGVGIRFTSGRQYVLFVLLEVIQELDPSLVKTLLRGRHELAAAAAMFPFGARSVREHWEKQAATHQSGKKGRVLGGSPEDIQFGDVLLDSAETGDFGHPVGLALLTLHEELEGNGALKECWTSTQEFRRILYSAGKVLGREGGKKYLDEIPDQDVRMFCQIELAASLAGLPEYGGSRAAWPKSLRSPSTDEEGDL